MGRTPCLLACLMALPVPASADDLTIDWLAHGQYALALDDGHGLLEDEGNLVRPGFILDRFLLEKTFPGGYVLGLALGALVPDEPRRVEASVHASFGRLGVFRVSSDVYRFVSYFDDSIGSLATTVGIYPGTSLGKEVVKARDGFSLGAVVTPCTCSRISLRVERSCIFGSSVPLKGSEASGYIFEYPSLWDLSETRAAAMVDGVWVRGPLVLDLSAAYRYVKVDDLLTSWPAFAAPYLYGRGRAVHSLTARLGADVTLARPLEVKAGYVFGYQRTEPAVSADAFGDGWRIEYGGGSHFHSFTHRVPLGVVLTPVAGLDLKLGLVGGYAYGRGGRDASAYLGSTGAILWERSLQSGLEEREISETLEISFTRLRWLDVVLRERLEFENRDLFRAALDALDDGIDETVAEDIALRTLRVRLESLVKARIAKGLVLDGSFSWDHVWQGEVVEELAGWTPHGDSRGWKLRARARLRYRLAPILSLWIAGNIGRGERWRTDWRGSLLSFTVSSGLRVAPLRWLSAHLSYAYTRGDLEVGPAPLLGDWDGRFYRGRTHLVQAGFGLEPLPWLGLDATYQVAIVGGTSESVLHRMGAEARFRIWKDVRIGVGYLGRILDDGRWRDDDYSGHAFRALLSGSF